VPAADRLRAGRHPLPRLADGADPGADEHPVQKAREVQEHPDGVHDPQPAVPGAVPDRGHRGDAVLGDARLHEGQPRVLRHVLPDQGRHRVLRPRDDREPDLRRGDSDRLLRRAARRALARARRRALGDIERHRRRRVQPRDRPVDLRQLHARQLRKKGREQAAVEAAARAARGRRRAADRDGHAHERAEGARPRRARARGDHVYRRADGRARHGREPLRGFVQLGAVEVRRPALRDLPDEPRARAPHLRRRGHVFDALDVRAVRALADDLAALRHAADRARDGRAARHRVLLQRVHRRGQRIHVPELQRARHAARDRARDRRLSRPAGRVEDARKARDDGQLRLGPVREAVCGAL